MKSSAGPQRTVTDFKQPTGAPWFRSTQIMKIKHRGQGTAFTPAMKATIVSDSTPKSNAESGLASAFRQKPIQTIAVGIAALLMVPIVLKLFAWALWILTKALFQVGPLIATPRDPIINMLLMPFVIVLYGSVAIVAIFFLGWVIRMIDKRRVRDYIESRGGRLLWLAWSPFGPGWLANEHHAIYRICYEDAEANTHLAFCTTALLGGVYFSVDQIIGVGDRAAEPVADL